MPITEDQVLARTAWVGASDVPAIVTGKGVYDLWLLKTRKVSPTFAGNEAMDLGIMIEPALMDWAEAQLGPMHKDADGRRDVHVKHPTLPMEANLDGQLIEKEESVDAKTTGLIWRQWTVDITMQWGEDGTSEVPDKVIFQGHAQMMCIPVRTEQMHVAALIGGRGRVLYHVPRVKVIEDGIAAAVDHFWTQHVQRDIPPENSAPSWDYARQLPRNAGEVLEIDDANLITEYRDASEIVRLGAEAEKRKKELKEWLVAVAGSAEYVWADGVAGAVRIYKKNVKAEEKPRPARIDTIVQYVDKIKRAEQKG